MDRRPSARRQAEAEEHQECLESSRTNPWQEASEGLDSPSTQEPKEGATMVHSARNGANHRCGLGPVQVLIPTGPGNRDAFRRALRVANGGMHAFRHGRISELQTKGVPGDLIIRWVGHVNLKITSLYTHFSEEFRRGSIAKLEAKNP